MGDNVIRWKCRNKRIFVENLPSNIEYYDLSKKQLINLLTQLLDPIRYEIYQRKSGEVCVYDNVFQDFIHENGYQETNLIIFWNAVVKELHKNHMIERGEV
jgi:hypothetical protein